MCRFGHNQLNSEKPSNPSNQGKKRFENGFASILITISLLFLDLLICGVCHEFSMISVPLGFEIYGFDRSSKNWVSENGIFTLGFFDSSEINDDDNDDGFVVGIRFNLGNKASNVPVWTVGGGLRASENSTLQLSINGGLVLIENPSGLIIWSSNTSNLGVKTATLLNNGNLVLMGIENNPIWESFNSPTSTLLPGQFLRFPQTLRAPSTRSISSYFSFEFRSSGELALVWENNVTYWRSHLNSPATVKEARFDSNGVLTLVDHTNTSVWSKSSKDFDDSGVVLRRLRIDPDGNLRIYSWDDMIRSWRVGWQAVENQCNVFASCGLYSLCGYNLTGPVCDCIYEDGPIESGKCKKMGDLANCKTNTSMMVLKQTVLYGIYPPHDFDIMLGEQDCKKLCSNDSSCIAVTSKNDGSGICTVKRTGFISGYRNPSVPSTSFIKVCLVPQAVSARGVIPVSSRTSISHGISGEKFLLAVSLVVFVTVLGFLIIEVTVFVFYRKMQITGDKENRFIHDDQINLHHGILVRLTFEEVKELTNNFGNQLSPSVFKGIWPNKTRIIAKVLTNVALSEKDFRVAVSTLGGTHHRNIVPLKGFCFEPDHTILIYEYISNESLDKWLSNTMNGQDWIQRLDIARGVARSVAYLHTGCQKCIAHGDLKLENVLLDENFVPMVTNYGIALLLKNNEVPSSSESLPEKDIYMLGEMLLQIAMCKRVMLGDDLHRIFETIDLDRDSGTCEEERIGVERTVKIALWCMQKQPFLRPSIGEVVKVLEGMISVDRPPSDLVY